MWPPLLIWPLLAVLKHWLQFILTFFKNDWQHLVWLYDILPFYLIKWTKHYKLVADYFKSKLFTWAAVLLTKIWWDHTNYWPVVAESVIPKQRYVVSRLFWSQFNPKWLLRNIFDSRVKFSLFIFFFILAVDVLMWSLKLDLVSLKAFLKNGFHVCITPASWRRLQPIRTRVRIMSFQNCTISHSHYFVMFSLIIQVFLSVV